MQTFLTIVSGDKELQIPISLDENQIRQLQLIQILQPKLKNVQQQQANVFCGMLQFPLNRN